jgi:hypothetical protein
MHPSLHESYAHARHDDLVRRARTQRLAAAAVADVSGIHIARWLHDAGARLVRSARRSARSDDRIAALTPR